MNLSQVRILAVDDELLTLLYLTEQIKALGFIVADTAKTGPEAVAKARECMPDLVFMDINMPGEYNGVEAARRIEKELSIPVVFITAYESRQYVEEFKSFGPFGYITKPFDLPEIETSIHIALFRSNMERRLKKLIERNRIELSYNVITAEVLAAVNEKVEPLKDLRNVLEKVRSRLGLAGIACYFYDAPSSELKLFAESSRRKDSLPLSFVLTEMKPEQQALIKKFSVIEDFSQAPAALSKTLQKAKVKSMMLSPLLSENDFAGTLVFYDSETGRFDSSFRRFARSISHAAAAMLRRRHLMEKMYEAEKEKQLKEKLLLRTERLASLGQLSSAITHEINQPLHSIRVLTDGIIYWDQQGKPQSYADILSQLGKISQRVVRIDQIIRNIRAIFHSPEKLEARAADLNASIKEVIDLFREKMRQHEVVLQADLQEHLPFVMMPESSFQQVVVNLCDNAIKALDRGGKQTKRLTIKTRKGKNCVVFSVADNGPGVALAERENIFDLFYSLSKDSESTGLGLYIVSNVCRAMNTEITLTGAEGLGTCFKLIIPAE